MPQFLSVLPYKLLHAHALAEMGMLSQSAQYCASILTTLHGLGNKVPPGLMVCRASALDLNDRLQQLAAARKMSLAGAFSAGTLVSSVGKLLDRGLSALMGGERQNTHSRSNSFTDGYTGVNNAGGGGGVINAPSSGGGGGQLISGHSHRGSTVTATGPSSPSATTIGVTNGRAVSHSAMGGDDGRHHHHQQQQPQQQQQQQKPLLSNFMSRVASLKSIVGTANPSSNAAPPSDTSTSHQAHPSEVENAFYFDKELNIWREKGVEPPPPPEEPPPPPTMVAWKSSPGKPGGGGGGSSVGGGVSRYAMMPSSSVGGGGMLPAMMSSPSSSSFMPAAPAVGGGVLHHNRPQSFLTPRGTVAVSAPGSAPFSGVPPPHPSPGGDGMTDIQF